MILGALMNWLEEINGRQWRCDTVETLCLDYEIFADRNWIHSLKIYSSMDAMWVRTRNRLYSRFVLAILGIAEG